VSDTDPIQLRPRAAPARQPKSALPPPALPPQVVFDRRELSTILNVYGRMVAAGEWRDYALDFGRDTATFSVYRRASEVPLYTIEKSPKLARKQGAYAVVNAAGMTLKRGPELARVLSVFDKALRLNVVR
jgi:hypothetical protein